MANDVFEAMKRYITGILPLEQDYGVVVSVDMMTALVVIKNSNPQPCNMAASLRVGRGDYVVLMRPRGTATWCITSVLALQPQGHTTEQAVRGNKAPGGKDYANVYVNNLSYTKSVPNTSVTTPIVAMTKTFTGGTPFVNWMGTVQVTSGASPVIFEVMVDEIALTVLSVTQTLNNVLAVPINFLHTTPLSADHTVTVQARSASAATVTQYQFSMAEI